MKGFCARIPFVILTSILLSASLLLGGCASKAKLIQVGAVQFETESRAAIEKIDELRRKEIEMLPLSPEQASEFFVKAITKSSGNITLSKLRILTEPHKTQKSKSDPDWQAFFVKMHQQYSMFTSIFASLDKGSLLAAPDVKDTIPILDKLIGKLAAFSKSIKSNPVVFIPQRAAIAAELEKDRDYNDSPDVKRLKLLEIEKRLRAISSEEEKITRETIEQSLKAARLGAELRKLIVNYEELSVDDNSEGLFAAFKLVSSIPGLNLSGLQAETEGLISEINADLNLKKFLDPAIGEINKARKYSG
jgi:hypothetical protein